MLSKSYQMTTTSLDHPIKCDGLAFANDFIRPSVYFYFLFHLRVPGRFRWTIPGDIFVISVESVQYRLSHGYKRRHQGYLIIEFEPALQSVCYLHISLKYNQFASQFILHFVEFQGWNLIPGLLIMTKHVHIRYNSK